ncbi:phage tail protein [Ruminiclostridium herbifermentans]|uniref:Phage tail protein n=1 Tax=Ruminiclostridium herbifermentans TaxID=2488810 RepID=A0A4U7J7L0_9FIRM|nr:phage tail protein [Ruminiclostridium herbifermentans]QNU67268.1 phage tail protein [Ruminiclostridium herbifermentans]
MSLATFGTKAFTVSNKKIYTLDELAFSQSLNTETQEVEGGKPSTYIKGVNLITLSFSINLDARFVDVKAEIDWWNKKMLSQVPEIFTIGGKVISKNRFLLKSVSTSDTIIGKNGRFLKAKLDLQFEEFASKGYKKDATSKKKGKKDKGMSAADIKALEEAMKNVN